MKPVQLDLNNPVFLDGWFKLPPAEILKVMDTLRRIARMTWNQLYADHGLRWEAIKSRSGENAQRLYSFRITQKIRAVGYRDGNVLRLQSLHPDHDSAYQ